MNKKLKSSIIGVCILALVVMFGCSSFQEVITPTYVSEDAAAWANTPTRLLMPYTTLLDARRVNRAIDFKLTIEKIKGGYYKNMTNLSIIAGEELKTTLFSPEGPVGLALPMLFGGTLGALLIPRPGDKKKKDGE